MKLAEDGFVSGHICFNFLTLQSWAAEAGAIFEPLACLTQKNA